LTDVSVGRNIRPALLKTR